MLIARAGEPIARLSPVRRDRRELGFARDQVWIVEDFDDTTPDEIVDEFER